MQKLDMSSALKIVCLLFLLPFVASAQLFPNLGGQRAGISALTFLKNDLSPRSIGMGGAQVSLLSNGYANMVNPAAASDLEMSTFTVSNLMYGGLNHSFLGGNFVLPNQSNVGFTISNLTPGAMEVRTEFQPEGTGEYFYVSNVAVGASFAKSLSDRFNFGIHAKYIREQLAQYTGNTAAVDLGFLYKTDFRGLQFAVVLQNFGSNTRLLGDYKPVTFNLKNTTIDSYPPPTTFKIGVSIDAYKTEKHHIIAALQLNSPTDNAENIRIGGEYNYDNLFFVRLGYQINVKGEKYPTAGLGLRTRIGRHPLMIDYGVKPTNYLGLVNCIGLSFGLNNSNRTEKEAVTNE
jgi:hypothetical protein